MVIGTTIGTLINVTENLSVRNGTFQLFDCGKASAALEVLAPNQILLQKVFTTNPALPGGTTDLTYTITNLNRNFSATNISFTDDLGATLSGLVATSTPLSNVCGAGSNLTGTSTLSFSGGTLAPGATCSFSVALAVPGGAAIGTYTSTSNAVTGDIDGASVTGNAATEDLFISSVPTFTKTFLQNPIVAGGTTTLEYTITNNSSTSALTDVAFIDPIGAFLSGVTISSLPAAGSCGAGSFFFTSQVSELLLFKLLGQKFRLVVPVPLASIYRRQVVRQVVFTPVLPTL